MERYVVKYSPQKWLSIEPDDHAYIVYRIPYSSVKDGKDCPQINNNFIVYILQSISYEGKDDIYVGKSTLGLANRPDSHEDKSKNWTYCYVLTRSDKKIFNDAIIQYIEDAIAHRVEGCKDRYHKKTLRTSSNTVNQDDIESAEKYLKTAYICLNILGLDLTPSTVPTELTDFGRDSGKDNKIPTGSEQGKDISSEIAGVFHIRSSTLSAHALIHNPKEVEVLAGSAVGEIKKSFIDHHYNHLREQLLHEGVIKNGKFVKNYTFDSPSAAASVILGRSSNGKIEWLDEQNKPYADLISNKQSA